MSPKVEKLNKHCRQTCGITKWKKIWNSTRFNNVQHGMTWYDTVQPWPTMFHTAPEKSYKRCTMLYLALGQQMPRHLLINLSQKSEERNSPKIMAILVFSARLKPQFLSSPKKITQFEKKSRNISRHVSTWIFRDLEIFWHNFLRNEVNTCDHMWTHGKTAGEIERYYEIFRYI